MKLHSIFNDVLGPIMSGPSSSHSAGCARIGLMTSLLYGQSIQRAEIIFDDQGSYPKTYKGQGSDFGFTGGLMGWYTDDPRMKDAVKIAKVEHRSITFASQGLSHRHPNEARINIFSADNQKAMSVLTFSTGGGAFEIVELDGFPVFIDGTRKQTFICSKCNVSEDICQLLTDYHCQFTTFVKDSCILFTIMDVPSHIETLLDTLIAPDYIFWKRTAPVILPVELYDNPKPIFTTAQKAIHYADITNKSMWELAIDYECSVGHITPHEILAIAEHILDIMEQSIIPPTSDTPVYGFLPYNCRKMQKNMTLHAIDTGVLNQAALYAIAVMENSCAHNIITAAPTAGSSGVLPATLFAIAKQMNCSRTDLIHALLAAGLTGVFIANQATFGAEVAGCQAENGAASAMAATAVVQLLGGNVHQGMMAASLALHNMLGLICDPVAGLTEIPCISRNVNAVSNAVLSANMIMWGFNPIIPLDESIETMYRVGQQLPPELRCTCDGGLCVTPTGQKCADYICSK